MKQDPSLIQFPFNNYVCFICLIFLVSTAESFLFKHMIINVNKKNKADNKYPFVCFFFFL